MSATAEELPGADLNGKRPHGRNGRLRAERLLGIRARRPYGKLRHAQRQPLVQAQGRYTFGSGARPLDGYTIKRAIGRGGFGEVYYATSDSGKEVALKLILRNLDVERRGVMQCMNLKCPNLLTIFDLKTSDAGDTFVVMEYVAGPSLASVLKQYPGGLPLAEVRHWLKGLVEGVAYLHDHGIVHRDLKPANLFMEEGIVKIGDYGLAKLITPSQGTEHSESIGTCHYMAPEIGSGKYNKPIDVYAIGVILYEMLTGRVPFDGETVNEVLMKHLTARPDVSMLAEPYRSIVAKALAKDPNHRPSRLYDLLPPEDAPRAPDVRIIGDGKAGRGAARRRPADRGRGAGLLHRPGHAAAAASQRPVESSSESGPIWTPCGAPGRIPCGISRRRTPRRPRRPTARFGKASYVRSGPAPRRRPQPPPPPPEPPPVPSGRVRLAELTSSMLWAAPLLALLTVPAPSLLGIDVSTDPQQLAYLFGMALLGTWTALIPNKAIETRRFDKTTKRLIALGGGLLLGVVGAVLAQNVQLGLNVQNAFFSSLGTSSPSTSEACTRSRPAGCRRPSAIARRDSASARSCGRHCWRRC